MTTRPHLVGLVVRPKATRCHVARKRYRNGRPGLAEQRFDVLGIRSPVGPEGWCPPDRNRDSKEAIGVALTASRQQEPCMALTAWSQSDSTDTGIQARCHTATGTGDRLNTFPASTTTIDPFTACWRMVEGGEVTEKQHNVLRVLVWSGLKHDQTVMSHHYMASKARCSIRTVATATKWLRGLGVLTWQQRFAPGDRRQQLPNAYRVNFVKLLEREFPLPKTPKPRKIRVCNPFPAIPVLRKTLLSTLGWTPSRDEQRAELARQGVPTQGTDLLEARRARYGQ